MVLSSRRLPSLLRVPASPVPRSQRYYEGATTSHPLIPGRLLVRSHSPRDPPVFVLARALPEGRRSLLRARALFCRLPLAPAARVWTRVGFLRSSDDPSCAFAPFQDPGRPTSPRLCGYVDAAPAIRTAKASAMADFGANPQLRHLLTYASRVALPPNVQGSLPAGWLTFAGRASNPLDRYERFQFV